VTAGDGRWPTVEALPGGDFVVAWTDVDALDGDGYGILARRFTSGGAPVGSAFVVNSSTVDDQGIRGPGIAPAPGGGYLIAWQDGRTPASDPACGFQCVRARRFDGGPVAGDFVVGTDEGCYAFFPRVASSDDGFVVTWGEDCTGPIARRLDASGTPTGSQYLVSHAEHGYQYGVDVAAAANDFVVVWDKIPIGTYADVYGRRLAAPPCPDDPLAGCKEPTIAFKGRLAMRDKDPDKGDSLVWKWVRGDATSAPEVGDPLGTDEYSVCLYDGGGTLVSASRVEPGGTCGVKPCWKALGTPAGSKGHKYVNKIGNTDGVKKLIVKPGEQGKAKAVVKAKGDGLDMPALPLALPVTAQLVASTGTCWSAAFEADGVLKNATGVFAAKSALPAGSPSAAFVR
jgi:hypothetical protein